MKATIVCGAGLFSGKEMMALELGLGLRSRGLAVSYITSLWGEGKFRARLESLQFPVTSVRIGFISASPSWDCLRMTADQLIRVPKLWWDYHRFLKRESPRHIIHTNWHHLIVLWPFLHPKRDWFWLHEIIPDKPQYRRVFGWLGRRLRGFVPVSQAVRESLLRIRVPAEKIRVIHNGIADPVPAGGTPAKPRNGVRVGIAGQVEKWKGLGDLMPAFASLSGKYSAAELHVFGSDDGPFAGTMKQLAGELGLTPRVFWHGFVPDKAEIYGRMDVCVVPSQTPDPLPTVAIEAAFFGLPVVASRCGGLPEIIEDSVTGFLVEPGNAGELGARLEELLADEGLRQRMGAAARRHAETHFNRERFVGEFIDLLGAAPVPRSA